MSTPTPSRLRLDATGAEVVADPPRRPARPRPRPWALDPSWSGRLALGTFVAYLVVSWFVLVFGFGSERWFFRDDWYFLTGRDGGSLDGLLEPHGEHLTALPVASYRVLYNLVGLDFTTFLAIVVTLHVAVVALVRVVMRRAGVGPWVATVAAAVLALYGTGEENVQWAFQITFVGAVLFGLVQLLCADHDGGIDRRDALGLAAGALAVACSGIGALMVAAVGAATLLRRGWRVAAFHTVPLGALYLLWSLAYDPRTAFGGDPPLGAVWDWVREGMTGVFTGIGQHGAVASALAVVLVAGLVLAWARLPWAVLRRSAAAPLALLLVAPLSFALTSYSRWFFGEQFARSSRYVYVATVLVLPALAVAIDAFALRWRLAAVPLLGLLVAGIPGNIDRFGESVFSADYFRTQEETILGIAVAEEIDEVPPWVRFEPNVFNGPDLDVGWLREARDDGRVPAPPELTPGREAQFTVQLGLAHVDEPFEGSCTRHTEPLRLDLVEGDRIRIRTRVHVSLARPPGEPALPVRFDPSEGSGTLEVQLPELSVRLTPSFGARTFGVCLPEP